MGHFRSDLRDIEFDLFEVFRVQDGPAAAGVRHVDPDTAARPAARAQPARHRPARRRASPTPTATRRCSTPPPTPSRCPESLKRAYRVLWDGEWWRLGLPAELGGYGVPADACSGRRPS